MSLYTGPCCACHDYNGKPNTCCWPRYNCGNHVPSESRIREIVREEITKLTDHKYKIDGETFTNNPSNPEQKIEITKRDLGRAIRKAINPDAELGLVRYWMAKELGFSDPKDEK